MQDFRFILAYLLVGALAVVPAPARAALEDCGQPVSTGSNPTASDALFTLRAAIGSETCDPCVCDVDFAGSGSAITASDALRILRRAVGQAIELTCPACTAVECADSQAPACGGTCPPSSTCAVNPFDEVTCTCLDDCQISQAPACGGDCDFALPAVLACVTVTFAGAIGPLPTCVCLPPGLETCPDSTAPGCAGVCAPGSICTSDGGACSCEAQPVQGACESAAAPACGGACTVDLICADSNGTCACLDATSHEPTCIDAGAPACNGACRGDALCAVNGFGSCECFEPCTVSAPPACGGACYDSRKQCAAVTISLGDTPFEACQCHVLSPSDLTPAR